MLESRKLLPPRYDPLDRALIDDPYPTYARLRAAGPLCRGGPGQWVVTRYADVVALLRDPRLGHQFPEEYHELSLGSGAASTFFQRIILYRDPPDHTRLRQLMGSAFNPTLMRRLTDHIGKIVDGLLSPVADRGHFDAIADLAFPLPVMVMCELLGLPSVDQLQVRRRALDLGKAFGTRISEQDRAAANEAVVWLRDYLGVQVAARVAAPGDDLLSQMLAAEESGHRLTHEEIIDNAVFLFFAGFETTMHLIGNGCAALLRHPNEIARLRADRTLVPAAVEEFLRYDAPIQGVARLVLEPVQVGNRTIKKGRVLVLLLGSANHDERQFVRPESLDIGRRPNPHVSFGGGPHHCLGAALARIEAAVAFDRLLQRFASLEPAADAVRQTDIRFRSYASVPVSVKPG
jgi:cytochrome P450